MTEIKIPFVAVGNKTEQLIRDAVEVTRENDEIKTRKIFSVASQLERGTNKFNNSLYKSILKYGASKKYFPNWAWKPSTEELLEIFNRAYQIATIAINTEVPLDRWGDFWDMASIWVELDPETAAWEGESHQRNLPALYVIYAMVHAIVDMEKDKSEFIEDFLDTIRTDEDINEAIEFFLPADKQPNATATPPSSTTETETEEENKKIRTAIEKWSQKINTQNHWFAVFTYLSAHKKGPKNMTAFCELMHEWGFEQVKYDSVQKANCSIALPENPSEWVSLQRTASGAKKSMIDALNSFKQCLKEEGITFS